MHGILNGCEEIVERFHAQSEALEKEVKKYCSQLNR